MTFEAFFIKFQTPTELSGFKFVSGNAEHPSDRFEETNVEILPENPDAVAAASSSDQKWTRKNDGFLVLSEFDTHGIAEGDIDYKSIGKISQLRLLVQKSHENWAILSEIHLRTPLLDQAKQ